MTASLPVSLGCRDRASTHPSPPVPWSDRCGIPPKPETSRSGLIFSQRVEQSIRFRLLALVFLVMPGEASDNQGQVGVTAIDEHFADAASVAVQLFCLDLDRASKNQV
jgi:hypothetical protein